MKGIFVIFVMSVFLVTCGQSTIKASQHDAVPGDWRDTSTPHQLSVDFQSYILGDILTSEEKMMLISWMAGNKNTDTLIRAGMPTDCIEFKILIYVLMHIET